jgi:hypothetical protein
MTPKEKAEDLYEKINHFEVDMFTCELTKRETKYCALIAVNEIIGLLSFECPPRPSNMFQTPKYWQEVKLEIEKL